MNVIPSVKKIFVQINYESSSSHSPPLTKLIEVDYQNACAHSGCCAREGCLRVCVFVVVVVVVVVFFVCFFLFFFVCLFFFFFFFFFWGGGGAGLVWRQNNNVLALNSGRYWSVGCVCVCLSHFPSPSPSLSLYPSLPAPIHTPKNRCFNVGIGLKD